MAGRGPAPSLQRYRRADPARGEWQSAEAAGWQGQLPLPPKGLLASSAGVWKTWFGAWWAAHWNEADLPALRLLIRLYDRVSRGDVRRLGELRQLMDAYGITPKGQQDRRWLKPEEGIPSLRGELRAAPHPLSAKARLKLLESRDPQLTFHASSEAANDA